MSSVLLILVYLLCSTSGLVFVRLGANTTQLAIKSGMMNMSISLYTIGGFALYACSFILWMVLLQRFRLSFLSPIVSGASYICVLLAAFFVLHESINKMQLAGAVVILVGIILMNIK